MQSLTLTMVILAMSLMGPAVTILSLPPPGEGVLLVLAPPWADTATAVTRAGGHEAAPVRSALGMLVQADRPGFAERLRDLGPFLILDGRAAAAFCGVNG